LPPVRAEAHALWAFPAAGLVQILAVPLVLFPLRGFLARSRGRGRPRAVGRTPTPAPTRPAAVWDSDAMRTVGGERLREDAPPAEATPQWRRSPPPPPPTPDPTPWPHATRAPAGGRPTRTPPPSAPGRGLFEAPLPPAVEAPTPRPAPPAPTPV